MTTITGVLASETFGINATTGIVCSDSNGSMILNNNAYFYQVPLGTYTIASLNCINNGSGVPALSIFHCINGGYGNGHASLMYEILPSFPLQVQSQGSVYSIPIIAGSQDQFYVIPGNTTTDVSVQLIGSNKENNPSNNYGILASGIVSGGITPNGVAGIDVTLPILPSPAIIYTVPAGTMVTGILRIMYTIPISYTDMTNVPTSAPVTIYQCDSSMNTTLAPLERSIIMPSTNLFLSDEAYTVNVTAFAGETIRMAVNPSIADKNSAACFHFSGINRPIS